MRENRGRRMARKLAATFLATFTFSMAWCCWNIATAGETIYYQGTEFYAMTMIYFFYIGFFVLIYGNFVSFLIESLQRKWFEQADWLYVLILGVFGSAIGLVFPFWSFVIAGILVAMLFAIVDKWLLKRWRQDKGNKMLFIAPFVAFALLWGYYHVASPSLPPFTAEEAIESATSNDDSVTGSFPGEAGPWKGGIAGYQVERTTKMKQADENVYIMIFTEEWQKGTIRDSWTISYQIERGTSVLHGQQGHLPPYGR